MDFQQNMVPIQNLQFDGRSNWQRSQYSNKKGQSIIQNQAKDSQGKSVDFNDERVLQNMTSAKTSTIGHNEMTYFISPSQGEKPHAARDSKQWSTIKDPHGLAVDGTQFTSNKHQQHEHDTPGVPALLHNQFSQSLQAQNAPSGSQQLLRPGDSPACMLPPLGGAQAQDGHGHHSHSQDNAPVFQQLVLLLQNQIKYNQMKQQQVHEDINPNSQIGTNFPSKLVEKDGMRAPDQRQPGYRTHQALGDEEQQKVDIYSDAHDLNSRGQALIKQRAYGNQEAASPFRDVSNLQANGQPLADASAQLPVAGPRPQLDRDNRLGFNNTLGMKEKETTVDLQSNGAVASRTFAEQQKSLIDQENIYTGQNEDGEFILVKQPQSGLCDVQMFSDNFARSTHKKSSHNAPAASLAKPLGQLKPVHHLISFLQSSIESKNCANPMQELILQALIKLADDKPAKTGKDGSASAQNGGGLLSQKMLDHLNFDPRNHLLGLADSGMNDSQFAFLIETLEAILEKGNCDGQRMHSRYQIKGLNFNGNHDLTDRSLRLLTEFVQRFRSVKVLSIERVKASHVSLASLFQALPKTRIVELNISGIPINHFCMEQLCKVLSANRNHVDLRVLHLRNTKLSDYCALMLMEYILGAHQGIKQSVDGHCQGKVVAAPIKIKYLSLRMNTTLGFDFQNGIIKLFQEACEGVDRSGGQQSSRQGRRPYHLKFLDLQFCNISQHYQNLIEKYINQNSIDRSNMPNKSQSSHKSKSSKSKYSRSRSISKSQRKTPSQIKQNNTAIFSNQMRASFEPCLKDPLQRSGPSVQDNPQRPRSTNVEAYRDDPGNSPVDFKQRFRNSFNNNNGIMNGHIGEIVIRRDTEGGDGSSSRRKAYNTGPSGRKKSSSIISESQLKSIQKFNLDQRGVKLSQSRSGGPHSLGTGKSGKKKRLVLDRNNSKTITIKVDDDEEEDENKTEMTADQDVVKLLDAHEQSKIQEEIQALEHNHDLIKQIEEVNATNNKLAIPANDHLAKNQLPRIPIDHPHTVHSRNSFQINQPSKGSRQKNSRSSIRQFDEQHSNSHNLQQNDIHFQSRSKQQSNAQLDERAMMDQTFQNLTIGQNEGNLQQQFQQEAQFEEPHYLQKNEGEGNGEAGDGADMQLQYTNSQACVHSLFNAGSPSQNPNSIINQNQEPQPCQSPLTQHSLGLMSGNVRRPTISSKNSLPENSYSDFDEQKQQSLGLLSQHQRFKDHQRSSFFNKYQLDLSRKSVQTALGERAMAGRGSVNRIDLPAGTTMFANSMASLQPYQSQDGSSDINVAAFCQSCTHYSDVGALNNQTRENRSSEHLQNIKQLIDSGSCLVDHGQFNFKGAQSVGHDLRRQLAGGTAGLNARLLASSGILLQNPKLLHNESIQSLLLQSLHNLKNGQMSACGNVQDQNGLTQSANQSTKQPSINSQDPCSQPLIHLPHQSQSLDQLQSGNWHQQAMLDLPRSSAPHLNINMPPTQTQYPISNSNPSLISSTINPQISTPGLLHRASSTYNSNVMDTSAPVPHPEKSTYVPRTCMPSTPHQQTTSATSLTRAPQLNNFINSTGARTGPATVQISTPGVWPEPQSTNLPSTTGPTPSSTGAPRNNQTRHVVFNGQNGPKNEHLGPLSMLIAEQMLRSAKSNGPSAGSKGGNHSLPRKSRKRSASSKGKQKRKKAAGAQSNGALKRSRLGCVDARVVKSTPQRRQCSSVQTIGRERRSGFSSKAPSNGNNAPKRNPSDHELAYFSQVCNQRKGAQVHHKHKYQKFFKNSGTIARLTSQKLAKNNIKWSVQEGKTTQPGKKSPIARAKSAGSKENRPSRQPTMKERRPSILLGRPQGRRLSNSTRSNKSNRCSDDRANRCSEDRASSQHTAGTRSNVAFRSTKSLKGSGKFGAKRFSIPLRDMHRRSLKDTSCDERDAFANRWRTLAHQAQNIGLGKSFNQPHYANSSIVLEKQMPKQYMHLATGAQQNFNQQRPPTFYKNPKISSSVPMVTPQTRKSNDSALCYQNNFASRESGLYSSNYVKRREGGSMHNKSKSVTSGSHTASFINPHTSKKEINLMGFSSLLKRPNYKGKQMKYINKKTSPNANLLARQTIQYPSIQFRQYSREPADAQSQNQSQKSYNQQKNLRLREISLENSFLRGARQHFESKYKMNKNLGYKHENLQSQDNLNTNARRDGSYKPYEEMTYDSKNLHDGIILGAGEALTELSSQSQQNNVQQARSTRTSKKNLTTDSSYRHLQVNPSVSGGLTHIPDPQQPQQQNQAYQQATQSIYQTPTAEPPTHQQKPPAPQYVQPQDPRVIKLNKSMLQTGQGQLVDQKVVQQLLGQLPPQHQNDGQQQQQLQEQIQNSNPNAQNSLSYVYPTSENKPMRIQQISLNNTKPPIRSAMIHLGKQALAQHQKLPSGGGEKSSVQTTMPSSILNSHRLDSANNNQRRFAQGAAKAQKLGGQPLKTICLPPKIKNAEVRLSVADLMSMHRQRQLLAQKSMVQQIKSNQQQQPQKEPLAPSSSNLSLNLNLVNSINEAHQSERESRHRRCFQQFYQIQQQR